MAQWSQKVIQPQSTASSHNITIEELDEASNITARYVTSDTATESASNREAKVHRIDVQTTRSNRVASYTKILVDAFLPVGFPDSVTEDYLEYQIYDSLQAFSSSIAGMLSSRAVLEGIGVGSTHTTPTAALLLSILQSSLGRLATILFASRMSSSLEPECKAYRFLADIFNDLAIILDCISPAIPAFGRVSALCGASVLRALCGVAAGSAKASLSAHFAKRGNVGELSAKDSSQETVISLMGMLVGSLLVPYITTPITTWTCLLTLLVIHLYTNYRAVKAVCLPSLNCQRACLVFSHLLDSQNIPKNSTTSFKRDLSSPKLQCLTPRAVFMKERIFTRPSTLRYHNIELGTCRIGVSMSEILRTQNQKTLSDILTTYDSFPYLLTFNAESKTVRIALKTHSQRVYLQAWYHAFMILRAGNDEGFVWGQGIEDEVSRIVREEWGGVEQVLARAGWDVDDVAILTIGRGRVRVGDSGDGKKDL